MGNVQHLMEVVFKDKNIEIVGINEVIATVKSTFYGHGFIVIILNFGRLFCIIGIILKFGQFLQ